MSRLPPDVGRRVGGIVVDMRRPAHGGVQLGRETERGETVIEGVVGAVHVRVQVAPIWIEDMVVVGGVLHIMHEESWITHIRGWIKRRRASEGDAVIRRGIIRLPHCVCGAPTTRATAFPSTRALSAGLLTKKSPTVWVILSSCLARQGSGSRDLCGFLGRWRGRLRTVARLGRL